MSGCQVPGWSGRSDVLGLDSPGSVAAVAEFQQANRELVARRTSISKDSDYEVDPRDQSTPLAMFELLMQIDSASAISGGSRDFLMATHITHTNGRGSA